MLLTIFNVIYVLVAIAMIALILLQRGAGAQAGSGFGSGASATVFGARGAANFLSRSTAILAGVFFLISLLIGIYLHPVATKSDNDLGVMSGYQTPEGTKPSAASGSEVPAAPPASTSETPAAPATPVDKPAAAVVPAAAPADKPVSTSAKPAPPKKTDDKKSNGGKSVPEKN